MARQKRLFQSISWQTGPGTAKLGDVAEVAIPAGYRFTDQQGAAAFAELTHNVPNPNEVGLLIPTKNAKWYLSFVYRDVGHVSDDEKAALDADAILTSLREGNDRGNEYRRGKGWPELSIVGWISPPAYDQQTHHLVWAIRARSEAHDSANYDIRVLGRTGVMSVQLVTDPKEMNAVLPTVNGLIAAVQFNPGNKYAEWRPGDKVAQYGLTGLITGGIVVGAAKTGLLAKFGLLIAKFAKAIVVGVIALLGGIWRLITGRGRKQPSR